MLSVSNVVKFPEIIAVYPRQIELENTISEIVCKQQGIKETDLWLMAMAAMTYAGNRPALALVAGTIRRMLDRGQLVGIDYAISEIGNTFLLPPGTTTMITVPTGIKTVSSTISVLHPDQ